MTIKKAAQQSLDVQDACNLSGVIASLDMIVRETLWPEARKQGRGGDYIRQSPIVYLFLYKMMSLAGHEPLHEHEAYDKAVLEVKAILNQGDETNETRR